MPKPINKGKIMPKSKGRPKGSLNKTTASLKDLILKALDEVGGLQYLCKVAYDDPRTFCGLIGRVLPLDVRMDMTDRLAGVLEKLDGTTRALPHLPASEGIEDQPRYDA